MKYNPLRNCILVEADPPKEQTKSGLYLSQEWKALQPLGTVIAVGPDVGDVKVGARLLFNRYAATQLEEQLRLITDKDVLATVEDEDESTKE